MKQRRVRENAVETLGREIQAEEVLMQDLAARVIPSHLHEMLCAIQPNRQMAEPPKRQQVSARTTAKIQDRVLR